MSLAARYARYGGPEVLTVDEIPTPEPGSGRVRIAVRAAGVNGIDRKLRSGVFAGGEPLSEPKRVGVDVAGVIDAVGPDVDGWEVGQAVFGQVGSGAAATHVVARPDRIVAKPDGLSFEQAAALPVAAETAHRTLGLLGVGAGQTLLIHAVAGGVGLFTAQLARIREARVVGTASAARHDALRELGVTPVTYGDGWVDRVREVAADGVDAVLDASGRGVLAGSVELAGGADRVVTIADGDAGNYGVEYSSGGGTSLPEVFAEVLPLVEQGRIRMPVAEVYPLRQIAEAHRRSEAGHVFGKIVVTVDA
ncbi:NADPH:quinone reductase-like Zn-dependent oxidoreductase [Haloactinopolyspora alba]|uniref:NADPH:quinone reductase-like Zn-dependent oxidoreductase n=1 Tax=Haloactinopolyspora alba TaxID=648780 RepID=A0A2P8EBC7_9ACTN|nr:NADP-dependent oxidoreductase [Haloactinopolyspora alba]PSL06763.1 NADPH:quinone reductase-like Zn-dependent oxidoreductase [Haloactinopolyspora alba]